MTARKTARCISLPHLKVIPVRLNLPKDWMALVIGIGVGMFEEPPHPRHALSVPDSHTIPMVSQDGGFVNPKCKS